MVVLNGGGHHHMQLELWQRQPAVAVAKLFVVCALQANRVVTVLAACALSALALALKLALPALSA